MTINFIHASYTLHAGFHIVGGGGGGEEEGERERREDMITVYLGLYT